MCAMCMLHSLHPRHCWHCSQLCSICRKLHVARQLACLFTQQGLNAMATGYAPTSSVPQHSIPHSTTTDVHSMPVAVRAHYMKLLLDWTQSALVKGKLSAVQELSANEQLQTLQNTWQLLPVVLMSTDTSAQAALNISLLAAAATASKVCSPEQAHSKTGQQLAVALQHTLLVLNTKFKQSFRPSLEHRLLTDAQALQK